MNVPSLVTQFTCLLLKSCGQVFAAAVTQREIISGCEGEDRINGQKRIGLNEDVGVIYSYSPFGSDGGSFTLQFCNTFNM